LDGINEHNSVFFLCDIQETFRGKILSYESLIATSAFLAKAANALRIPLITTEQKPFKPTVAELAPLISPERTFSKSLFSMLTPEVLAHLQQSGAGQRKHVVLFGIEAHVCVLQTTLDLLRRGYHVHAVVDAIGSQNAVDRDTALARFAAEAARAGANNTGGVLHLTTAESVLFEILKDAQHPSFKALLPAMKELAAAKKGGVAPSASQGAAKL
jgi:nicotinamidase-related amidase